MLYSFLKIWLRLALKFYLKRIDIKGAFSKEKSTPSLLVVNHSNSFLDALMVTAYHPKDIYYLARGDAFNKKWAAWILRKLNIIPIHRLEEGRENLLRNAESFEEVMLVFKQGGSVLIFPEGLCKNENTIRPLRKGAARIVYQAWCEADIINLEVQPVTMRYHSFTEVPKALSINISPAISMQDFDIQQEAFFYNDFNDVVKYKLETQTLKEISPNKNVFTRKILLAIPALLGYLIHKPFYALLQNFIARKTKNMVFYDSVLFGSLMLLYPFFVLLLIVLSIIISGNLYWLFLLIAMPFTAWCYKLYKEI